MQVLTSGMWPQTSAAATCNLPRELEQCTTEFAAYYLHANSGGGPACAPRCLHCGSLLHIQARVLPAERHGRALPMCPRGAKGHASLLFRAMGCASPHVWPCSPPALRHSY